MSWWAVEQRHLASGPVRAELGLDDLGGRRADRDRARVAPVECSSALQRSTWRRVEAETLAFARTLDELGHVGDGEAGIARPAPPSEVGVCGERVVGDLRLGGAHRRGDQFDLPAEGYPGARSERPDRLQLERDRPDQPSVPSSAARANALRAASALFPSLPMRQPLAATMLMPGSFRSMRVFPVSVLHDRSPREPGGPGPPPWSRRGNHRCRSRRSRRRGGAGDGTSEQVVTCGSARMTRMSPPPSPAPPSGPASG